MVRVDDGAPIMTQAEALKVYRELVALERLEASITRASPTASYEWQCGLQAIADRIAFDRYCLSLEDPTLVGSLSELFRALEEHGAAYPEPAPAALPELPPGARVH